MKPLVGVDIGATSIRVVEIVGIDKDGFAEVRRVGIAPVRRDAVVAGVIRSREAVAYALVRAVEEAGLAKLPMVAGIATAATAVTRMSLPSAIKANERLGAIRSGNRPISPTVALDTAALAYNLLGSGPTGEGTPIDQLAVGGVLAEQVQAIRDVFKLAKLRLRAVDLSGAATLRAVSRSNGAPEEVESVVDIGASKIAVTTRQGLHVRSTRTVPSGGQRITEALITALGGTYEEADERKTHMRLGAAPNKDAVRLESGYGEQEETLDTRAAQTQAEEVLAVATEPLLDQIGQSLEADYNGAGGWTQSVLLCGGTSLLRGFNETLEQRLGIPVHKGRPIATLANTKANERFFTGGVENPDLMLMLATAIGLALWREV